MPTLLIVFFSVLIGYPVVRLVGALLANRLVKRVACLGQELARDYSSPGERKAIDNIIVTAVDSEAMPILAFGYVPLMGFLLWLRIKSALSGASEEYVAASETPLESDQRWRRFFVMGFLATALWSPIAAILFVVEVVATLPLLLLAKIPQKTYLSFFAHLSFLMQRFTSAAHSLALRRTH